MGKIVTFYSFKGGVGRSMALANIGVLLGQWGYRVLLVDFDLEAPGLEKFFAPKFVDEEEIRRQPGVTDWLCSIRDNQPLDWRQLIRKIQFDGGWRIDMMGAGKIDQNYYRRVRSLDVAEFYSSHDGGNQLEQLRSELKEAYDFVLVDSRTGNTEIGGICTVQFPDMIVALFVATEQAFEGAIDIVERAERARQNLPFPRPRVPVLPVPSRFDIQSEYRIAQGWLRRFADQLRPIYAPWLPVQVPPFDLLQQTKVPYVSYFGFGEQLPVLEHGVSDPVGLGYAYEGLASLIARNVESVEQFIDNRDLYVDSVLTASSLSLPREKTGPFDVFLCYDSSNRKEVRNIARKLSSRGIRPWFDEWELLPGDEIHSKLSKRPEYVRAVAVFIGQRALSSGTSQDLQYFISRSESHPARIIPVLLEGTEHTALPEVLSTWKSVDFGEPGSDPLGELARAIEYSRDVEETESRSDRTSMSNGASHNDLSSSGTRPILQD